MYKSLNSKDHISYIFVDLRKTFDIVDHAEPFENSEQYGLRGKAVETFRDFYSITKKNSEFQRP